MFKTASCITWAEISPHLHSIRQQGAIAWLSKAQVAFLFFIQSMYLALLNTHQGKENRNRGGSAVVADVSVEPKVASSNPSPRHFSNFLPF